MNAPRVLVGSPTYNEKEYCRKEFVSVLKNIDYPNYQWALVDTSRKPSYYHKLFRAYPGHVYRVSPGENSREAIRNAQEFLRRKALEEGYEYLVLLESDVFPPRDFVKRLLRHEKRVVGGVYYLKNGLPCVYLLRKGELDVLGSRQVTREEEREYVRNGLKRVHAMGLGCVAIHRSVLQRFAFWFSSADDYRMKGLPTRKYTDTYFYLDMHNNGIPVYADTDVVCVHKWGGKKRL